MSNFCRVTKVLLMTFILMFSIFISMSSTQSTKSSNIIENSNESNIPLVQPLGSIIYKTGNWIVNSTETYIDTEFIVSGNIIIKSGGVLTLRNSTLVMNVSKYTWPQWIKVRPGGIFNIWDKDDDSSSTYDASLITDAYEDVDDESPKDYRYFFRVYDNGTLSLNNSIIEECGKFDATEDEDTYGLVVESDLVVFKNSTIRTADRAIILSHADDTLFENMNATDVDTIITSRYSNRTMIRNCWFNQSQLDIGFDIESSEDLSVINTNITTTNEPVKLREVNKSNFINSYFFTASSSNYCFKIVTSTNITFDRVQILSPSRGFYFHEAEHINFFETKAIGTSNTYFTDKALYFYGGEDLTIENCIFKNIFGSGIYNSGSIEELYVYNCTFENITGYGIQFNNVDDFHIDNCSLYNVSQNSMGKQAIRLSLCSIGNISNCHIEYSYYYDLYIYSCDNIIITNNEFGYDPSNAYGIYLSFSYNNLISYNDFYYHFGYSIFVSYSDYNNFDNNNFYGKSATGTGIRFQMSESNEISNSFVTNYEYGIYDDEGTYIRDTTVTSCGSRGIFVDGSTLENVTSTGNGYGIFAQTTLLCIVKNSTFLSSTTRDVWLNANTHVRMINCTFNLSYTQVSLTARLYIGWWVDILVQDMKDIVPGAIVTVKNNTGYKEAVGTVGDDGHVILPVFQQMRTADPFLKIIDFNPHNFSATLWPDTAYLDPEADITANSNLTITFNVNTRPPPPRKFTAVSESNNTNLSWEFPQMNDLQGFEIFRSRDPNNFNYSNPIGLASNNDRYYIDLYGASNWTTYHYQVRAYDGANQKSNVSNNAQNGDWVIADSVYENFMNRVIQLNGSLIIESNGRLELNNVTLMLNISTDGEYGVLVQDGGYLEISDIDNDPKTTNDASNITSMHPTENILFIVAQDGILYLNNSIVNKVGYFGRNIYEYGLFIAGNGSIIRNNKFNSTTGSRYGIYLNSVFNVLISNNEFSPGFQSAIYVKASENCIINRNLMSSMNYYGMSLRENSKNNTLSNNTIEYCGSGINIFNGINNKIINNTIMSFVSYGIYAYWCDGTIVQNNIITDSPAGMAYYSNYCDNIQTINNDFQNLQIGIRLYRNQYALLQSNNIVNMSESGIISFDSSYLTMVDNNITECVLNGISFEGKSAGSGNKITGGNITECFYAIYLTKALSFKFDSINVWENLYGIYLFSTGAIHINRSTIKNNYRAGIYASSIYYYTLDNPYCLLLENTTLSNPLGDELRLDNGAVIWAINISLSFNRINFEDSISKISFFWYVDVYVEDMFGLPAGNASVEIKQIDGEFRDGTTDSSGFLSWQLVHDITNLPDSNITSNPYTVQAALGNHSGTNITEVKGPMVIKVVLDNQPPSVVKPEVAPTSPYTTDDLVLTFGYSDPEGDAEYPHMVKWYKSGVHQSSLDNLTTVDSTLTKKGEFWRAYVWVSDGAAYSEYNMSNIATIVNSKPVVTDVTITPSNPSSTTDITVSYLFSDIDADSESLVDTEIQWWVDHGQGSGFEKSDYSGSTLSWKNTEKDDLWKARVRPHDGENFGDQVWSNILTIGNTRPEIYNLKIIPESPTSLDDLTISYEFFDIDDDPEAAGTYKWFVDHSDGDGFIDSGVTAPVISNLLTNKGDIWSCEFTPYDGYTFGANYVTEDNITIGNTPPNITDVVAITPSKPASNEDLKVLYTYNDHDGDAEGSTSFKWYVDSGDGTFVWSNIRDSEVHSSKLNKGTKWFCQVIPHDGETFGKPVNSSIVTIRNSPPSASDLEIKPEDPIGGEELRADYDYYDIDGDSESGTKIRWYRDDVVMSEYHDLRVIPEGITRKGETWYYSVQPFDGGDYDPTHQSPMTEISNNVTIGNSKPIIKNVSISPERPTNPDKLIAIYEYFDADNDTISDIEIKWYKNNVFTGIASLEVFEDLTKRDDIWYFELRIFDGSDWSEWKTSPPNTIYNIPPELVVIPDPGNYSIFENDVFDFSKIATDPDGDILSFKWYVNDEIESDKEEFSLVTSYDSEPLYQVRFEVFDGTITIAKFWNITVINKDRAPYFEKKDPEISDPKIKAGEPFDFSVDVDDPDVEDSDKLTITWYLDSEQVGTGSKFTYTPKDYEAGIREIKAIVSDGELNTTTTWNVTVEKVEDESEKLLGQSYDWWGLVFAIISGAAAIIVFIFGVIRLRKKKGKLQEYMEQIEEITESEKMPKDKETELLALKGQIKKEFTKELITENHYLILERELDNAVGSTRKTIIGGKIALSDKFREDVDDILDDGVVTRREFKSLMRKLGSSEDMTAEEKKQLKAQMTRWMKENRSAEESLSDDED